MMPISWAKYILCKSLVSESLLGKDPFRWAVAFSNISNILCNRLR